MKSFCVIGLGKFGQAVVESLVESGSQVMIIDSDSDRVTAMADMVTNAVIGDPTNENFLLSAGIQDYECAIVCMTANINANILITILLKELGIKKVVVRALNDGHRKVLEHIGADMIVFPERDMGEKLGYMLTKNNITDFVEFANYKIVELSVPRSWIGKSLSELGIRKKYDVNIIALNPSDGVVTVTPSPHRPFVEGDRVSMIGTDKGIDKITSEMK